MDRGSQVTTSGLWYAPHRISRLRRLTFAHSSSGSDLHIYRGDTPGIKQTGFTLVSTDCVNQGDAATNNASCHRATSSAASFTSLVNRCRINNGLSRKATASSPPSRPLAASVSSARGTTPVDASREASMDAKPWMACRLSMPRFRLPVSIRAKHRRNVLIRAGLDTTLYKAPPELKDNHLILMAGACILINHLSTTHPLSFHQISCQPASPLYKRLGTSCRRRNARWAVSPPWSLGADPLVYA